MGLYGVMTTSVSGMSVQSDRMGTVADNIANINTTGYKGASTEFATLIAEGSVAEYVPGSVSTIARRAVSQQGDFTYTKSPTDLAVSGNGFFMVESDSGTPFLTRAGNFVPDSNGDLVNAAGFKLLGYNLLDGSSSSVVNSAAGLQVVSTSSLGLKATPSTSGKFGVNLPADADITAAANLPAANAATAEYAGKTSIVTYDNLGHQVTLDVYSAKTADNTWQITVYNAAGATNGGFPYAAGSQLTTTNVTFDGTTGALTSTSPQALSFNIPNGSTFSLDISKMTQLAASYSPQTGAEAPSANGSPPSAVDRLEISDEGIVTAVYKDGSRVDAFKIPLATVASPDNLTAISGNVYATNKESGDLQLGTANESGRGKIISGALESSTVDLASELTTMVQAQRNYTANSKVFQTGTELLDVLVNLVR
ncbi:MULTISPECIES: flagellar hook protein FlgE [unclassified Hyphomicrobium]|uniref:flagellar hook protein FlgE n=1 Tax=unclassified Hyphomicrobium TaxID=2619925 RepID=UPI000213D8D9|nr:MULTISPECIES: flagellar hook protein FlgE [unclassified Hyphomicrobium]CCB67532.1 flagellar hook protein FlgE [Hyphomicrobium sp. MC1]